MKKILVSLVILGLFLQIPTTFAASKWLKIFGFTSESSVPLEGMNGYKYNLFTGTGTKLTTEKLTSMSDPSANYYILDGKKRLLINSLYWPFDESRIVYYKRYEANSNPVYTIQQLENGKVELTGTENGKVAVYKQKLDLKEVKTTGTIDDSVTMVLGEGEGVQPIYTTDWQEEFSNIEGKLSKISTIDTDIDNRMFAFTYKKGGFGGDYDKCLKDKKMPFCFKKDGDKLVFSSRGQLSTNVSFWFKK